MASLPALSVARHFMSCLHWTWMMDLLQIGVGGSLQVQTCWPMQGARGVPPCLLLKEGERGEDDPAGSSEGCPGRDCRRECQEEASLEEPSGSASSPHLTRTLGSLSDPKPSQPPARTSRRQARHSRLPRLRTGARQSRQGRAGGEEEEGARLGSGCSCAAEPKSLLAGWLAGCLRGMGPSASCASAFRTGVPPSVAIPRCSQPTSTERHETILGAASPLAGGWNAALGRVTAGGQSGGGARPAHRFK